MAKRDGLSGEGLRISAEQRRHDRRGHHNDALHRSAKRALEITRAKQAKAAAEKAKKPKGPKKSKNSAVQQFGDRMMVEQLVNPSAQQHGDYQAQDFKLEEVTENGKKVEKTIRVVRNLGGTPIERWNQRGVLDERQMAAILFYQQAWHRVIQQPRVVANWSAVIVRQAQGAIELYAGSQLAAKESLRLLDQEVFFRLPVGHFAVWQNVVIWDEPAGVAGGRAGFLHKQAEGAARAIVSIIASMIADVVIDSSRKDFGDLLIDLDAPRRPGRKST